MSKKRDTSIKKSDKNIEVNKVLLENFVELQKALTNLAIKFEDLSSNISRQLELFELAAKSFADKPINTPGVDQEFLKKLDSLLDQNKTISKAITMMEERVRNRTAGNLSISRSPAEMTNRFTRPLPR